VDEFVGFTITGLVTAGIYAIVACGLTLTYTTTGIFNWAHGAFVAVGAYTYWQLTEDWGVPVPLAVAICLLVLGPAIGVATELGVMRRLEGTSEATRMVVTLALMLGILGGINWIWDIRTTRRQPPFFAGEAVTIAGQRIPYDDLMIVGIGVAVALVLRWLLYRLRAGVTMRASVDDRSLVTLTGASVRRTAILSWMAGSTLAVLAGVLVASKSPLRATPLSLLIVNAFAASIIGRLRSLPLTFLGATVIGLVTGYSQGYLGSRPDIPGAQYLTGLVNVLPVVVLFVVLLGLPQSRLRGNRSLRIKEVSPRPTWPGSLVLAGAVVLGTVAVAPLLAPGDLNSSTRIWGFAIVGLSLVPLVGYAGRLAACPLSFAAVGAIVVAHLGGDGSPIALVWAALIAAVVGSLVALTALRLAGLYLGLATAAFAVMLDGWIFTLPKFTLDIPIPFTGRSLYRQDIVIFQGQNLSIRRFRLAGVDTQGDHAFLVFSAVIFALLLLAVVAVRRSDAGLRLIALKDSPLAAATLGMNDRLTTLAVFALSAGMAGIGGALIGAAVQRPAADGFAFFNGLGVLVVMVVVGIGSPGAAIGAGLYFGGPTVPNLFPSLSELSATAVGLAGVGLGRDPNGLIQSRFRPDFGVVGRARAVLVAGLAAIAVAYVLALTGTVGNWWFVGVTAAVILVTPRVAPRFLPDKPPSVARHVQQGLGAPAEHLGLTVPLDLTDVEVLDRELALPGAHHGA
jgi:branched-chain amino acid transport system permease protein